MYAVNNDDTITLADDFIKAATMTDADTVTRGTITSNGKTYPFKSAYSWEFTSRILRQLQPNRPEIKFT